MKRAALFALLLLAACRKKRAMPIDDFVDLRNAICRCTEMSCVQNAVEYYRQVARREPSEAPPEERVAIERCITNIAAITPDAGVNVPAMPPRREADALISAARVWQKNPKLSIAEVSISYVDARGALDDTHGVLTIAFGASNKPVDDPKRKTGAPVNEDTTRPTSCPSLASMPGKGWSSYDEMCRDAAPYIARCSVADIWTRAIKLGAPKDALAVITFKNVEPPGWTFNITDEPRNVHIAHELPDDCERTLEKPSAP